MGVGVIVVLMVFGLVIRILWVKSPTILSAGDMAPEALHYTQEMILGLVAVGLAVATVVELAYTLFTDEPDEALNPVMLAVAVAIILQLANFEGFEWKQATGLAVSILVLAGLFATRRWITEFDGDKIASERRIAQQTLRREALVALLSEGRELVANGGEHVGSDVGTFDAARARVALVVADEKIVDLAGQYHFLVKELDKLSRNGSNLYDMLTQVRVSEEELISAARNSYQLFGLAPPPPYKVS
jgi:hypothetical protein